MKPARMPLALGALALAALLAGCDRSPQRADGATAPNDPGVATATNGVVADTGPNTNGGR